MKEEFHLIDQLEIDQFLSRDEWIFLIDTVLCTGTISF